MNQQYQEQLSTLMDGELGRDETLFLMRRVSNEVSLSQRWSSYHVARQVLRRQDVVVLRSDFSSQILDRINNEQVAELPRSGRWLQWAGGGAIAASVAAVALIYGIPQDGAVESGGKPLAASVDSNSPAIAQSVSRPGEFRPPMVSPVLDVQPASVSTSGFASPSASPIDPRLQSYLIRHYDAAANNGQSAMMPYVLLVVPTQQATATSDQGMVEKH